MAKTAGQIQAEMDAIQSTIPELSVLTSTSNVSIYKLFKYLVALAQVSLYNAWDLVKVELQNIASTQIVGTPAWYVNLALSFNGGLNAQRASCIESGAKVILKVAKQSGSVTSQLSDTDLSNLTTHIHQKKIAGTDIAVISQTADLVKMLVSVKYTGVLNTVQTAVETALKNYLANLEFGSTLSKSLVENIALQVPGVLDASVDNMEVNYGSGYELIAQNVAAADAGYYEFGTSQLTFNMYQ